MSSRPRRNTEGTPPRARASARGESSSADSSDLRDLRAREFPPLPAVPASSLDGEEASTVRVRLRALKALRIVVSCCLWRISSKEGVTRRSEAANCRNYCAETISRSCCLEARGHTKVARAAINRSVTRQDFALGQGVGPWVARVRHRSFAGVRRQCMMDPTDSGRWRMAMEHEISERREAAPSSVAVEPLKALRERRPTWA